MDLRTFAVNAAASVVAGALTAAAFIGTTVWVATSQSWLDVMNCRAEAAAEHRPADHCGR